MPESIEKQIGNRLNLVRELLLLTINEVSLFTKIPNTTLRRIENGLISVDSKYTEKLFHLYGIKKADLRNLDKPIPDWKALRQGARADPESESKPNLEAIRKALDKKPKPKKAIKYRILESSFLNDFNTTELIKKHLISRYNWTYSYHAVLVALESLIEDGLIEIKERGLSPQEYRKARIISNIKEKTIEQIAIYLEEITPQDLKHLHNPVYKKSAGMLFFLKDGPKKRSEIFSSVNYRNLAENHKKSLKVLSKLNLVEMTIKDKPNSSLQTYRLTQKGLELIDKFVAR